MPELSTACNLFFSLIGVIFGLSGSIAFYYYGNSIAVFWASTSGCIALLNLHLHYLYHKQRLEEWHNEETMTGVKHLAAVFLFLVCGMLVWYIFKILYYHLPIYPIKDSVVIVSVWTFMTAKWAFLLYRSSKKYGAMLQSLYSPILSH